MTIGKSHPRHVLDEVIHSPVRLSIMATLAHAGQIDFASLRETVEASDSLLSKYLSQLEAAGYVHVEKGYVGRRPRSWYSLTDLGRDAFERYRRTLELILGTASALTPEA